MPFPVGAIEDEVLENLLGKAALEHAVFQQAAEAGLLARRRPLLDLGDHAIPFADVAGKLRPVGRLPRSLKICSAVHEGGPKGIAAIGTALLRHRGPLLTG